MFYSGLFLLHSKNKLNKDIDIWVTLYVLTKTNLFVVL